MSQTTNNTTFSSHPFSFFLSFYLLCSRPSSFNAQTYYLLFKHFHPWKIHSNSKTTSAFHEIKDIRTCLCVPVAAPPALAKESLLPSMLLYQLGKQLVERNIELGFMEEGSIGLMGLNSLKLCMMAAAMCWELLTQDSYAKRDYRGDCGRSKSCIRWVWNLGKNSWRSSLGLNWESTINPLHAGGVVRMFDGYYNSLTIVKHGLDRPFLHLIFVYIKDYEAEHFWGGVKAKLEMSSNWATK
ncbi:hypothetical protein NC651_004742 [Populus alba x Populus x berolinensis]|nr:hypothetical protein NC651_004742 [Populus alba x Populus x berolinensis]